MDDPRFKHVATDPRFKVSISVITVKLCVFNLGLMYFVDIHACAFVLECYCLILNEI